MLVKIWCVTLCTCMSKFVCIIILLVNEHLLLRCSFMRKFYSINNSKRRLRLFWLNSLHHGMITALICLWVHFSVLTFLVTKSSILILPVSKWSRPLRDAYHYEMHMKGSLYMHVNNDNYQFSIVIDKCMNTIYTHIMMITSLSAWTLLVYTYIIVSIV